MTDLRDAHPDEGTIHAWLDRQLDATSSATLETHLQRCDECAERVAEARGLIAGTSRLLGALDGERAGTAPAILRATSGRRNTPDRGSAPAGRVTPASADAPARPAAPPSLAEVAPPPVPERSLWRTLRVTPARAAVAAALILAAGLTLTHARRSPEMVATAPSAERSGAPVSAVLSTPGGAPAATMPMSGASALVPAAGSIAAMKLDSTATTRVAVARASVRAQRDTTLGADLARVAHAPSPTATAPIANTIAAAKAADSIVSRQTTDAASMRSARPPSATAAGVEAPQCYRLESATGTAASWGLVALPLVLVLDSPVTRPDARILTAGGDATDSRAVFRRAGADSLFFTLERNGYAGTLSLGSAGEIRAGVMRSTPLQLALGGAAVAGAAQGRTTPRRSSAEPVGEERKRGQESNARKPDAGEAQYGASNAPATPVVARRIACP